ncbi:MAG: hypothetical protein A2017_11725 [Lentisphaerae bacterium GWF2_44_16]|nr:MAG: hypothetical protein A2017_11725 [Lentisphaerae bacterium GWF2_44_16]
MKFTDKKYWGAFIAGVLWGIVIAFIGGWIYLRSSLVYEIKSNGTFDETVKKVLSEIPKVKGWNVESVVCAIPNTADNCRIRSFKLCNGNYAKIMLDNADDRKVSCVIPCTMAVYEKPDGKTYIGRVNVSLLGYIIGGLPAKIFAGKVNPEQQEMLKKIIE